MQFDHYHIRLLEQDDAAAYFELIDTNRPRLEDFFAGLVSQAKSLQEATIFLSGATERIKAKTYFPFVVIDNTSGRLIGFIDVKNIDWHIPKAELGCFMDTQHAGKGIAKKALLLVIEHLFSTFDFLKLLIRTHESNSAARTLATQCGFGIEGHIRRDYRTTKGELVDLLYYGLLKK